MTCLEWSCSLLPVSLKPPLPQLTFSTVHLLLYTPLLLPSLHWVTSQKALSVSSLNINYITLLVYMLILSFQIHFEPTVLFKFPFKSGNLQLGPPAATTMPPAGMWGASPTAPNMFAMPGMPGMVPPGPRFGFQQPPGYVGHAIPPNAWGPQLNPQSPPPLSPPHIFCPPVAGPGGAQTNPFLGGAFPPMGDQQGPPRPMPRASSKEAPPPSSAFTALDPLGDKEKKSGKDMFKDFQIAKPPAIPARKGEANSTPVPGNNPAFDQYFTSKVGLAQDSADHDDFDISQIPAVNGKPAAPPASKTLHHMSHVLPSFCSN